MNNIIFEFINIEEEIKRIIDDILVALISENIKVTNIYSFINTLKDIFPEKNTDDEKLKEKIHSYLVEHPNIKKIIGDVIYIETKDSFDIPRSNNENEIEKMTKNFVMKKMRK